jgi:membrane-bound metal-dependent hydrolase YbcI (DUF457 family)
MPGSPSDPEGSSPTSERTSLLALFPAHMLVGAACGEVARGDSIKRSHAWLAGAAIAVLPDLDSVILLSLGYRAPTHGLYTHTLIAVAVIGILAWSIGGRRWGILAIAAYSSHLLVDLLRAGKTTSVYPLGPFSADALPPLAPLFPSVPFEWGESFGILPGLYGSQPLRQLLLQTLIGLALFLGAVIGAAVIKRLSRPARS